MAKQKGGKFYVVWQGRVPGIYDTWAKAKEQIDGFPNAQYRGYPTKEAALAAFAMPFKYSPAFNQKPNWRTCSNPPLLPSICVDAACNMKTGSMEYRGVNTEDGSVVFAKGPFPDTTNNVGEFLALVHALALLNRDGNPLFLRTPIYSDSLTAMTWVRRKRANTKMTPTPDNAPLRIIIERAEEWLRTHQWANPIIKWETKEWGEIPADYGRK